MKENKETIKTVAITILLTANISFILGIIYNQRQNDMVDNKIEAAVQSLKVEINQTKK